MLGDIKYKYIINLVILSSSKDSKQWYAKACSHCYSKPNCVHLVPTSLLVTAYWYFPIGHGGSIYAMVIGKYNIQYSLPPSGKPVVKHLPGYHKVHTKIGSCDEICSSGGGYFRMVRKQVTLYMMEKRIKVTNLHCTWWSTD